MKRWDDLRLFLAVARAGTLTSAAADLEVGVSTLHRRLGAFEAALGVMLFEKGPRGYQLTHAGEALLAKAEDAEEAMFAAARTVVGHDQQASGEVRITLPLIFLPEIAPHLAAFARVCPRVRPVLQADDGLLDLHRETDIALRATTHPVDTAIGRKLCAMAWGLYAPADVDTDTDALPWVHYIGMDRSPAVQWRRKAYPNAAPMMFVHGVSGMASVLAASGGQGLLPCFVGDRDPRLRRVCEPVAHNQLWVLVHAELKRSARVRALMDFLIPRIVRDRARFEATGACDALSSGGGAGAR